MDGNNEMIDLLNEFDDNNEMIDILDGTNNSQSDGKDENELIDEKEKIINEIINKQRRIKEQEALIKRLKAQKEIQEIDE